MSNKSSSTIYGDWQVTVVLLVLSCLVFEPETAVTACAIIWGLFFLKRWLSK